MKGHSVSQSATMSNQFCPYCGAFVQATEASCPYCRKALSVSPSVSETTRSSFGIDPDLIRRKQNLILWLFIITFVWSAVIVPLAFTALRIAREEVPEATMRDVRFNRIEVQSKTYQTLVIVLKISKICSNFFFGYCCVIWFQYIRSMGYSRWGAAGHLLLLFIPLVNLIVFLVMIHKGRVLIRLAE